MHNTLTEKIVDRNALTLFLVIEGLEYCRCAYFSFKLQDG